MSNAITGRRLNRRTILAAIAVLPAAALAESPASITTDSVLRCLAELGGIAVPARSLPADWQPLAERATRDGLVLTAYPDPDLGISEDEYTLTRAGWAAIGRDLPECGFDQDGNCRSCHEHLSYPHHPMCPYGDPH